MKERIKSFVLTALILLSIGLTSITWIDKRLWPDGYSLFANIKEWPLIREFFESQYSLPLENLSKARKIVIADGSGASAVFYNGDRAFNAVYSDIGELMTDFLEGKIEVSATTPLTKENLRELLNEQIMYAYVNYSVAMPPSFYGQLMGVKDSQALSEVSAVRDFFILPTGAESLELLATGGESGAVMRYEVKYSKTESLINLFTEYASDVNADNTCVMALQMNMDVVSPDDAVKMKTVLDSFLVLDSASTADSVKEEIKSENPIAETIPEELIESFSHNPNSIYRYTDSEGTVVYLENSSTLKIYKNGVVEYEAVNPSYGIALESGNSLYEALNSAIRFSGKIYSSATNDSEFTMSVASDILFNDSDSMEFLFDYYHEGTQVAVDINFGDEHMLHGAEISVVDGKIVKFRMLLREYKKTERKKDIVNIYGAIDKVADVYAEAEEPVEIKDMFLAYKEDGTGQNLVPCWVGYAEGNRIVLD